MNWGFPEALIPFSRRSRILFRGWMLHSRLLIANPDNVNRIRQKVLPTVGRPAETKGAQPTFLTLNVRIFRKNGSCYAECLNLSLIARRSDETAALHALFEQIVLYLTDASESGTWDQAVSRRASWKRWVWYYLDDLAEHLSRIMHFMYPRSTFKVPFDRNGRLDAFGDRPSP